MRNCVHARQDGYTDLFLEEGGGSKGRAVLLSKVWGWDLEDADGYGGDARAPSTKEDGKAATKSFDTVLLFSASIPRKNLSFLPPNLFSSSGSSTSNVEKLYFTGDLKSPAASATGGYTFECGHVTIKVPAEKGLFRFAQKGLFGTYKKVGSFSLEECEGCDDGWERVPQN